MDYSGFKSCRMLENEAILDTQYPPNKKVRYWNSELEEFQDEDMWYQHMNIVKERNLVRAAYENAMNNFIEGSGCLAVEDEAVSMAIRCHGLTCTKDLPEENPSGLSGENASTSTSGLGSCSTSTEDILSHAVSAAIRKKGLGAVDR